MIKPAHVLWQRRSAAELESDDAGFEVSAARFLARRLASLREFGRLSQRWKQIRLEPAASQRGYFSVRIDETARRYVPISGSLPMFVRLDGPNRLDIDPAEGRLEQMPVNEALLASLRMHFGARENSTLGYPGARIVSGGTKADSRRFRKHIETSRRHQCSWDGAFVAAHPEIIVGWPYAPSPVRAPCEAARIAVAVHLYYTELWDEFETLLGRWTMPFRLFLTISEANPELAARVRRAFPDAIVRVVENRGRDVRPFLLWLEEGAFDKFDLVCKLHSKRSCGGGRLRTFGDALRRANLHDLVADPLCVEQVVARFDAADDLGLVGSERFLSASTRSQPKDVMGKNRARVLKIVKRLGAPLTEPEFDFFEGTMFWARPRALAPIAGLRLSVGDFEPESGRLDGTTEHAVERLFNHVARTAGYRVESTRSD